MTTYEAKNEIRRLSDETNALRTALIHGRNQDTARLIARFQQFNAPRCELIERFGLQRWAAELMAE